MLFQTIDYVFGTDLQNHHVLHTIQNINSLVVSTCASICSIYYFTTSSQLFIPYTLKMIMAHCTIDLLMTNKMDVLIHHMIIIGLGSFFFYKQIPVEDVHFETIILSLTEVSSIFLVGHDWIQKNSPLYELNNYMFISTFFYTRLYLCPKYLLLDTNSNNYFMTTTLTFTDKAWYYGSQYAFMAINVYWGSILIKTICKKLRKCYPSIFSYETSEFCLQFTYYFSLILALYVYSPNINYQWLDISGIMLLTYNSGQYHHVLYNTLINNKNNEKNNDVTNKFNVLSPRIRMYYVSDIVSIHVRCVLYIVSRILPLNHSSLLTLGCVLAFHSIALYQFYEYVFYMLENKFASNYSSKDTLMDHAIRLPVLFDMFLSFVYSNTMENAHHNLLAVMFIAACLFIRPGYELNHTFLHIGLIYQTYTLCIANT